MMIIWRKAILVERKVVKSRRIEVMALKATLLKIMRMYCHWMALQMTRKMLLKVERKWHSWRCPRKTHSGGAVVEDGLLDGEVLVVGALGGDLQAGVVDGVLEGGVLLCGVVEGGVSVDGFLEGGLLLGEVLEGGFSVDGVLEGGLQVNSTEGDVPGYGELEEDHPSLQGEDQSLGEDL